MNADTDTTETEITTIVDACERLGLTYETVGDGEYVVVTGTCEAYGACYVFDADDHTTGDVSDYSQFCEAFDCIDELEAAIAAARAGYRVGDSRGGYVLTADGYEAARES